MTTEIHPSFDLNFTAGSRMVEGKTLFKVPANFFKELGNIFSLNRVDNWILLNL